MGAFLSSLSSSISSSPGVSICLISLFLLLYLLEGRREEAQGATPLSLGRPKALFVTTWQAILLVMSERDKTCYPSLSRWRWGGGGDGRGR